MKLVSAIIRPPKLPAVLAALEDMEIQRMTICDAQGFERHDADLSATSAVPTGRLFRKLNVEIVVNDDFVARAVDAICAAAKTGSDGAIGDGKLFVFPVEDTIQIDDQKRGPQAV